VLQLPLVQRLVVRRALLALFQFAREPPFLPARPQEPGRAPKSR